MKQPTNEEIYSTVLLMKLAREAGRKEGDKAGYARGLEQVNFDKEMVRKEGAEKERERWNSAIIDITGNMITIDKTRLKEIY